MSGFHYLAGNVAAEMHGVAWQTKADNAQLALINVVTADVDQRKLVLVTGAGPDGFVGQLYYPITTGTGASWKRLATDSDVIGAQMDLLLYGDGSDGDRIVTVRARTYSRGHVSITTFRGWRLLRPRSTRRVSTCALAGLSRPETCQPRAFSARDWRAALVQRQAQQASRA